MTDTKVTVVDSQFITHALAYQVIEAAKWQMTDAH